jgi:hypothetical protein
MVTAYHNSPHETSMDADQEILTRTSGAVGSYNFVSPETQHISIPTTRHSKPSVMELVSPSSDEFYNDG